MKALLLALVTAVATLGLGSGCAAARLRSTAWEYKVIPSFSELEKREARLNELGQDGWVLTGVGPDGASYLVRPKK